MQFLQKFSRAVCSKPENIFLICSLIFGLSFVLLTPPFQTPDEEAHFARALQVSYGNLYHASFVDKIPFAIPDYWEQLADLKKNPEKKIYWSDLKAHILSNPSSTQKNKLHTFTATSFVYHPISYLSSGAAIAIARLNNLPSSLYLYLGRVMNLIVWILLSWTGLRIIPFFKWESMFIILLPMSLFMGASISADSFNNAVCFLLICAIIRALYGSENYIPHWVLALVTVCALAAASGKQIYALLFYLILFAYTKFKHRRSFWYYVLGSSLLILIASSWVLFNPNPSAINSDSAFQQLTQTLLTPFQVLFSTLGYYHTTYLEQFIGVLGLLNTQAPGIIYTMYKAMFIVLLTLMCITTCQISGLLRFTAAILICLYISTIIFSLYLLWPNSNPLISEGVQGRYFIPFALLLPIVFSKSTPSQSQKWKQNIFKILHYIQKPARVMLVLATITGLISYNFALCSRFYYENFLFLVFN